MNVNPFSLPSVEFSRTSKLPQKSGVYFVLRGDEILYIGKSTNIKARWATHSLKNILQGNNAERIAWLENASGESEIEFIKQFKPAFNKAGIYRGKKDSHSSLFVEKIDKVLSANNMTRADLAKKMNISQSLLSLIYGGTRDVSPDVCIGIAKALNISVVNALSWANLIEIQNDELTNEMNEIFDLLPEADRIRLIAIGKTFLQLQQENQP